VVRARMAVVRGSRWGVRGVMVGRSGGLDASCAEGGRRMVAAWTRSASLIRTRI